MKLEVFPAPQGEPLGWLWKVPSRANLRVPLGVLVTPQISLKTIKLEVFPAPYGVPLGWLWKVPLGVPLLGIMNRRLRRAGKPAGLVAVGAREY